MPPPLPEFEQPPLDEVAIGVQFEPLQNLQAAHFGLFWSEVRGQYPFTENQPPLPPQIEQQELRPAAEAFRFGSLPIVPRFWFIDQSKNNVIQVQRDRFHRNWRQLKGTEPYPRFANLIQDFKREWQGFKSFVERENLGEIAVGQCELIYINNIEKGSGWDEFSDLPKVFSPLRPAGTESFLSPPEMLGLEAKYKLPDGRGRLSVELGPGFRGRDLKIVLAFNLTVRGSPAGKTDDQVFAWFDLAHEWIVRAFDQLTTPAMHALWKKRS